MKDLLLEIGTEELPARFVPAAMEELKAKARERFTSVGLSFKNLETLGTPRRLALLVTELAEKSADKTQEALGPGLAQAKDKDGNWTPAAQGFARSQNTTPEKLETRQTDRGERLCFVRREAGVATEKLLPAFLPELIRALHFPKAMVWEESRFAFARPIRWIVALYGAKPVKFEIAGVKSGKKTWGLRFHGTKPFDVPAPARYADLLKNKCVVVDTDERKELIQKQARQAVKSAHGHVPFDRYPDLLEEVVHLVEHPVAVLCSFDKRHLELPPEVLVTTMKKHQKFFPVFAGAEDGKSEKLLAQFVGIRNGMSENQNVVREGYERVLAARLSDATFFFEQDRKTKLAEKASLLKDVLLQKELGSLWEKTERVTKLATFLGDRLKLGEEVSRHAVRVSELGKADLVSQVVGEFPELQGVMGRIYAALDGEPAAVANGVEQHYWPLTTESALPKGPAAALVSLADKLDTLVGDFLVGLIPSGSADPYGLRRAGTGIVRILRDRGWRLDMAEILRAALAAFSKWDAAAQQKSLGALRDFMKQRWSLLMEGAGYRFDEIEAVSLTGFADVVDMEKRLKALHEIRKHPDFTPLAVAFKRASNILKQAREKKILSGETQVAADRLKEDAEKKLFEEFEGVRSRVTPLLEKGDYEGALKGLVHLRAGVDKFFEAVMVMAPETDLRDNRLALLDGISRLFRRVADFAVLQDVPAGGS